MKIKEITDYLEEIAPLHYQENYDNSGLLVGNEKTEINKILITLDCTEEVINEVNNEGSVKSNLNLLCSLYVDSIFIQDKSK